jgi:hypothetical protein
MKTARPPSRLPPRHPARQHHPTDPGELVGRSDDHDVAGGSRFQATHPLSQTRSFALDAQHRSPGLMDEHLAQIRIPPLTDPSSFTFPPLTIAPVPAPTRPQTLVPCERRPPFPMAETTAVATSGPTPGFLLEPSAGGTAARDLLEILTQALDLYLQVFPLLPQKIQQAADASGQPLVRVPF